MIKEFTSHELKQLLVLCKLVLMGPVRVICHVFDEGYPVYAHSKGSKLASVQI